MTLNEAQLFFPAEECDDLQDLYDDRLFEYKQFFLSKTPIRKVFLSKLDKLQQMHNAYCVLTNESEWNPNAVVDESKSFSSVILEAFHQWEREKSEFKSQLMRAGDAPEIHRIVSNYLLIVDAYRQLWYTEMPIEVEIAQLSKDEDPMYVLAAIQTFQKQGGIYFEDILKLNTNSFLLKEMKRLSLLIKNYGDGRSI